MIPQTAPEFIKVCVTGGPCSGKTTSMAKMQEFFSSRGHDVIIVPEAATILINTGFAPAQFPGEESIHFQQAVYSLIENLEDNAVRLAEERARIHGTNKPTLIICDRGQMDAAAYCTRRGFDALLKENETSVAAIRDARYDVVIHLAVAPEEHYTTENNSARHEDYPKAFRLDQAIRKAWTGHPHLKIINNDGGFENKVNRTIGAICNAIGEPESHECERKYLLSEAPDFAALERDHGIYTESSLIHQTYLISNGDTQPRIRERIVRGTSMYYFTEKGPEIEPGKRVETERTISEEEYSNLMSRKDPGTQTITKERHCFVYADHQYELDVYTNPRRGLAVLEVEVGDMNENVVLPPFLDVEKELTGDKSYSNAKLARIEAPKIELPVPAHDSSNISSGVEGCAYVAL